MLKNFFIFKHQFGAKIVCYMLFEQKFVTTNTNIDLIKLNFRSKKLNYFNINRFNIQGLRLVLTSKLAGVLKCLVWDVWFILISCLSIGLWKFWELLVKKQCFRSIFNWFYYTKNSKFYVLFHLHNIFNQEYVQTQNIYLECNNQVSCLR